MLVKILNWYKNPSFLTFIKILGINFCFFVLGFIIVYFSLSRDTHSLDSLMWFIFPIYYGMFNFLTLPYVVFYLVKKYIFKDIDLAKFIPFQVVFLICFLIADTTYVYLIRKRIYGALLENVYYASLIFTYLVPFLVTLFIFKKQRLKMPIYSVSLIIIISALFLIREFVLINIGQDFLISPRTFHNADYKTIVRREEFKVCPKPVNRERILAGGEQMDFIVSKDGKDITKIWDKTAYGYSSGKVSFDGSMIAYLEENDLEDDKKIWIRCTEGDGQYSIPLKNKIIRNKRVSISTKPSWSHDSKYLLMNYVGDLIKINVANKEKTIIYPSIAIKEELREWEGKKFYDYEVGQAFFGIDDSIFYVKFSDEGSELHRINPKGKDVLITKGRNLIVHDILQDNQKILYARDGKMYLLDFIGNTEVEWSYKSNIFYSRGQSRDNKYDLLASGGEYGIDNTPNPLKMRIVNLENGEEIDILKKIKTFLKDENISWIDKNTSLSTLGWSANNNLLVSISFDKKNFIGKVSKQVFLAVDPTGENIKVIIKNTGSNQINPPVMHPTSWL